MTDDQLIDNAATASQNISLIDDEVTREAIKLNIIAPLRALLADYKRQSELLEEARNIIENAYLSTPSRKAFLAKTARSALLSTPKPEATEGGAHEKGIEAASKALGHEGVYISDATLKRAIAAYRTALTAKAEGGVFHIAWNEAKTVGVVCEDPQLAYELRKGAMNPLGIVTSGFMDAWAEMTADDNCTTQTVNIGESK